jgi:hypothetical protein
MDGSIGLGIKEGCVLIEGNVSTDILGGIKGIEPKGLSIRGSLEEGFLTDLTIFLTNGVDVVLSEFRDYFEAMPFGLAIELNKPVLNLTFLLYD